MAVATLLVDIPLGMDEKTALLLGKNFSNRPEDQLNADELAVSTMIESWKKIYVKVDSIRVSVYGREERRTLGWISTLAVLSFTFSLSLCL